MGKGGRLVGGRGGRGNWTSQHGQPQQADSGGRGGPGTLGILYLLDPCHGLVHLRKRGVSHTHWERPPPLCPWGPWRREGGEKGPLPHRCVPGPGPADSSPTVTLSGSGAPQGHVRHLRAACGSGNNWPGPAACDSAHRDECPALSPPRRDRWARRQWTASLSSRVAVSPGAQQIAPGTWPVPPTRLGAPPIGNSTARGPVHVPRAWSIQEEGKQVRCQRNCVDCSNGRGLPGGREPGTGLNTPGSVALFEAVVQK